MRQEERVLRTAIVGKRRRDEVKREMKRQYKK